MISKSAFEKRVAVFAQAVLEEAGFQAQTKTFYERDCDGLVQFFEFQPGTGRLKGSFTVNVGWRYTVSPIVDDAALDCSLRIGRLMSGRDVWFSRASSDALDASLSRLAAVYREEVLPFLDRHRSVRDVIDACESGALPVNAAFGTDAGWQRFNLAYCYLRLGDVESAIKHLSAVVQFADGIDPDLKTEQYLDMLRLAREERDRLKHQPEQAK